MPAVCAWLHQPRRCCIQEGAAKKNNMKFSLGSWAFSFGPLADNPVPFNKNKKTVRRQAVAA
jgi:hypothetical protein